MIVPPLKVDRIYPTPTHHVELANGAGNSAKLQVVYWRIDNVPGFSHLVFIKDGAKIIAKDWLSNETKPSPKVTRFYLNKHASAIEQFLNQQVDL